jgi:hypothetical protein
MKIKCSFPDCPVTREISVLNWLTGSLLALSFNWYLCEEHRFTEEEWDDLYEELKRTRKLS